MEKKLPNKLINADGKYVCFKLKSKTKLRWVTQVRVAAGYHDPLGQKNKEIKNMDLSEISKEIGMSIIIKQHENYKITREEDLTYIRNLFVTISGISTYLKKEKIKNKEISNIASFLRDFAETLFVENCVDKRDAESAQETEEEFIEEIEVYFDYIFKNKKYPR